MKLQSFMLDIETNHSLHLQQEKKNLKTSFCMTISKSHFLPKTGKTAQIKKCFKLWKRACKAFVKKTLTIKIFSYTLHNDTENKHFLYFIVLVSQIL